MLEQTGLVRILTDLVRRMATVTISAPLASTAARVCSKSLYLPVPTAGERVRFAGNDERIEVFVSFGGITQDSGFRIQYNP